jgi:recombination protein RecT
MRVDDSIGDIIAEPVWEGDKFEYEIDRGKKRVVKHKQTLDSIDSKKPKGAYCLVLDHEGNTIKTEIMTFEQIKSAWKKSQMRPVQDNGQIKAGSTHAEFMDEMIRKTIINRACKPIINSSSDANLFRSANRAEQVQAQVEAESTAEAHANQGDIVDVEWSEEQIEEAHDPDTGEVQEEQKQPEPATAEAGADDEPGF